MDFKKRVNGSWVDTPNYIHNTFTDTITTLPTDIYTNDTTATVGLKGQMEQNGTPTPDNPIQPQETGERTCNLSLVNLLTGSALSIRDQFNALYTDMIYDTDTQYTISFNFTGDAPITNGIFKICFTYTDGTTTKSSWITTANITNSLTSQSGKTVKNLSITDYNYPVTNSEMKNIMLNTGSTALPYEPYGYKLTISSANTTTPIYLGEVETTRQIKKLVLTGKETWYSSSKYTGATYAYLSQFPGIVANSPIYCSHLIAVGSISQYQHGMCFCDTYSVNLWIFDTETSVADFKTYLQQQYAAGTPITVWYVLAEPETAVVNEPLRKIGDYADTVSGITIPTIAGTNTIDIDTTLKPSEMSVNYKGWHPVKDVHRFNGTSWD